MPRTVSLLVLSLTLTSWLLAQDQPKPDAPGSKADSVQDLVFFGDKRPVLLRFHIELEGKPFRSAWREFMADYFKYLDQDGDGFLSKTEGENIQSPAGLFGLFTGAGGPAGTVPFRQLDTKKTDGKIALDELTDYFLENRGGPFEAQPGAGVNPQARALNEALFTRLDADKDGKLSPAELKQAADSLLKLDVNEDEMISQIELGPNPYAGDGGARDLVVAELAADEGDRLQGEPYAVVGPGPDGRIRSQLQTRYGKGTGSNRNRKLSADQLGLDAKAFELLDRDKDGVLDGPELERFADRPADLDFAVRMGKKESIIELLTPSGKGPDVRRPKPDLLVVDADNARLELRRTGGSGAPVQADLADFYKQQFKTADGDGNGYLDNAEAERFPQFRGSFKQMDKDGDGMLFEKEMLAYLKGVEALLAKATASRLFVSVSEGQGIFELLDANRDGRLTIRELKNAPKLLAELDRDGDGFIGKNEVPRSFQFALGRGGQPPMAPPRGRVMAQPQAPPPTPQAGPAWFRKMDRNRDGDVSRREFLGAKQDFDRLDQDGDNLISPEEAGKA